MALVKVENSRSSIANIGSTLEITIPTKKNIFLLAFLGFWLCGWAMGEVFATREILFGQQKDMGGKAFLIAWLGAWTVGGIFAITAWLWMSFGKEKIQVSSSEVAIKKNLFGKALSKEYSVKDIKNIRVSADSINPFDPRYMFYFWGIGGGRLAFDYGSRTVRFACGIDEAEAAQLLSKIKEFNSSLARN